VADGAEWIRKQLESKLPMLDSQILDFYHLGQHVWAAANSCFNKASDKAKEFASEILHIAKHEGPTVLLSKLIDERKKYRSNIKRKSLKELIRYIAHRFDMEKLLGGAKTGCIAPPENLVAPYSLIHSKIV